MSTHPDTPLAHRQARKYFWVALRKLTLRIFFAALAILIIVAEEHDDVRVALPESGHTFRYAVVTPMIAPRYREFEIIDVVATTRLTLNAWGEGDVCLYHGRDPETQERWIRSIDSVGTISINLDDRCVHSSIFFDYFSPQRRLCEPEDDSAHAPALDTDWYLIGVISRGKKGERVFIEGDAWPKIGCGGRPARRIRDYGEP